MSFASPPVNSTIPATSYPSSPESTRSPPTYFPRTGPLVTPDYRTAIQSDPFEDLTKDRNEDPTLQQAVFNAQNNIAIGQPLVQPEQPSESAVWNTLSRFASAPVQPPVSTESRPNLPDSRKSLDVEAFKRLLLTGNTGIGGEQEQTNPRRPAPPPPRNASANGSPAPATTFDQPSPQTLESKEIDAKRASFISSLMQPDKDKTSTDATGKFPPPAPAPRRAKSVKSRDISPLPAPLPTEPAHTDDKSTGSQEKLSKRPPAPPMRRSSQRLPSYRSDDSANTPSPTASPAEPVRPITKPPLPPMRRQTSSSRRASQDLAPTLEEPESDIVAVEGSRRSSMERPALGSRNSSLSIKRASQGLMNPPPLPPPRKGRGSSRSSMDGFRPSLATLMGEEDGQENQSMADQSQQSITKDRSSLTASNADSILAELASLQREVDAARRS